MEKLNFETFSARLNEVKWFKEESDYAAFSGLVDTISGEEGRPWLDALLDAVCVEEDYEAYESLYNAIWRFPDEMSASALAEALPQLARRMNRAAFQVWRFYIPVPQNEERKAAFIRAALLWSDEDKKLGRKTIATWLQVSASDEKAWTPIYKSLGGKALKTVPTDPIPDEYGWPDTLKERLAVWRALPPDKTNEKVFWFGSEAAWRGDLPHIIEALALRHGAKWRDILVWLNPMSFFARDLYPVFIETLANAPETIRDRALDNIKKVRVAMYTDICDRLKPFGVSHGKASWPGTRS